MWPCQKDVTIIITVSSEYLWNNCIVPSNWKIPCLVLHFQNLAWMFESARSIIIALHFFPIFVSIVYPTFHYSWCQK
jgi:hypothetical protein